MLAWFDTPTGRYFGQVTRALDGREWTTVAPADAATLRKRLSEMMAGVTDSATPAWNRAQVRGTLTWKMPFTQ